MQPRGGDRETIRTLCGIVNILTDTLARVVREQPEPETYTVWLRLGPIELQPEFSGGTSAAAQRSSSKEDGMANETRTLTDTEQFRIFLDGMTDRKGKKVTGIDVEVVADDAAIAIVSEEQADTEWLVKAGDPGTTTVTLRGTNPSGKPFLSAFSVIVNPGDVEVLDVRLGDNEEQQPDEPAPAPAPSPADGGGTDTTGGATGGGTPAIDPVPAPDQGGAGGTSPDAGTTTGGAGGAGMGGDTTTEPAPAPAPSPTVEIDPATGQPVTPTNPGA
jgi:hypothetical protein